MLSSEARLYMNQLSPHHNVILPCSQIEALIPVWIKGSLDNARRFGLLAAECRHCERVWESCIKPSVLFRNDCDGTRTEDIPLVQPISSNNLTLISLMYEV